MAVFVLVHGAFHGGWCYARVAVLLRQQGHDVFTPTLTGLGERAHLTASPIDLSTHIEDIVNVLTCDTGDDHARVGMAAQDHLVQLNERVCEKLSRLPGWTTTSVKSGHDVMIDQPHWLTELLAALATSGAISAMRGRAD